MRSREKYRKIREKIRIIPYSFFPLGQGKCKKRLLVVGDPEFFTE